MAIEQALFPTIDFTDIGPRVGERFPDVTLPDQRGELVDLHAVRGKRRALVVFYRSAQWWPFCKTQLVELQRSLADFAANDVAVFAISYDSVDVLATFADKHGIAYPLLSDEGSRVIRALGLLNEQVHEHHAFYGARRDDAYGVPYAGTFVLDEDGVVVEKRFQSSYRVRETGAALLERSFGARSSVRGAEARAEGPGVAVRAYLDEATYRFFQRLWLTVDPQIEPGLHVYGRPIPDGYVPLSIDVEPVDGLVVGEIQGPAPEPFRMDGLDEAFVVYSGTASFALPLTFTKKVGDLVVRASVRYQACSATDCLIPTSLELEFPLPYQYHVDAEN